jgi:hypothetical protein
MTKKLFIVFFKFLQTPIFNEIFLSIFPKHNFKISFNPFVILNLLKSSVVTPHLLHLIEFDFSFSKQFLHTECPQLGNVIESIIKCFSSDAAHTSSSKYLKSSFSISNRTNANFLYNDLNYLGQGYSYINILIKN